MTRLVGSQRDGGAGGDPHSGGGLITGYMFKLIRESLGVTQETLATHLCLEKNTIQAWETGRRPLTATKLGNFTELRLKLMSLNGSPTLLDAMEAATHADYILAHVLRTNDDAIRLARHPLGTWLIPHDVSEMLAWPITGKAPSAIHSTLSSTARRGPVACAPTLTAVDRRCFFERLRIDVSKSLAGHPPRPLFVHQATFRAGWDRTPSARAWLHDMWRQHASSLTHWSPGWLTCRAIAIAEACHGNPELLRCFLGAGFTSEICDLANLNYWAYWAGEINGCQSSNAFMVHASTGKTWTGVKLVHRLNEKLTAENPYLELNVQTLHALMKRPITSCLLSRDDRLTESLFTNLLNLADSTISAGLSQQRGIEVRAALRQLAEQRR